MLQPDSVTISAPPATHTTNSCCIPERPMTMCYWLGIRGQREEELGRSNILEALPEWCWPFSTAGQLGIAVQTAHAYQHCSARDQSLCSTHYFSQLAALNQESGFETQYLPQSPTGWSLSEFTAFLISPLTGAFVQFTSSLGQRTYQECHQPNCPDSSPQQKTPKKNRRLKGLLRILF